MTDDLELVTHDWNSLDLPTAITSDYDQEFVDNYTDILSFNSTIPLSTGSPTNSPSVLKVIEPILARYLLPLVIAAGTFGNVTSLAVLLRRRMRRTSVYMYLSVLACTDLSVLYLSAFKTWFRLMTDFELMHVSNAACKITSFLLIVSQNMSAWLIVLTTIDRFVAVWLPLRAVAVCRHRRACLAIIVLFAIVSVFNIDIFWTVELISSPGRRPMCLRLVDLWGFPLESIKLASYSIVPFVVILLLNCAIVVRLRVPRASVLRGGSHWSSSVLAETVDPPANAGSRRGHQQQQQHHSTPMIPLNALGNHSHRGGRGSRPRSVASTLSTSSPAAAASTLHTKVTYMLLAVSITWLALTAPFTLRAFVIPNVRTGGDPQGVKQFVTTVCFLLMYVNHAINFYLYCVTGRKFRRELVDMMTGLCAVRHDGWDEDGRRGRAGKASRCLGRRCCGCCCCCRRHGTDRTSTEYRSEMRVYSAVASSRVGNNNMANGVGVTACRARLSDVTHHRDSELDCLHGAAADTAV